MLRLKQYFRFLYKNQMRVLSWEMIYNNQVHLHHDIPDSKVHGANMGPTWVLSSPGGPHVGPMNLPIWDGYVYNSRSRTVHHIVRHHLVYVMLIPESSGRGRINCRMGSRDNPFPYPQNWAPKEPMIGFRVSWVTHRKSQAKKLKKLSKLNLITAMLTLHWVRSASNDNKQCNARDLSEHKNRWINTILN